MDIYQSRLPDVSVQKILKFEPEIEPFGDLIRTFPEFFSKVTDLKIELTSKLLRSRKIYQNIACDRLLSICQNVMELQIELKESTK